MKTLVTIQPGMSGRGQRNRLYQAIVWLCALAFTWQLVASSSHQHSLAERVHDCVSCHIGGNLHGGVPPAPAVAPPPLPLVLYLAPFMATVRDIPTPGYLIPPHQAPPAHPSFR
jgi:hypothetical protein